MVRLNRYAANHGGNVGSRYSDGSAVDTNAAATDSAGKSGKLVVCVAKTSC
ncbi:hypothetical protein [Glaciecola sp. MF2-115]|uniref:hypothetical protein n=1 Tax=Glaciecola sp. MF2-115 TaxID=3384827 RepID=UPI0039A140F4